MAQFEQWSGFNGRLWKEEVNVRDFIQNNYTPYEGDESFLADGLLPGGSGAGCYAGTGGVVSNRRGGA